MIHAHNSAGNPLTALSPGERRDSVRAIIGKGARENVFLSTARNFCSKARIVPPIFGAQGRRSGLCHQEFNVVHNTNVPA